jgi:virulence-associated protein VagC
METATVILEGDRQTVRLPKSVRLPGSTVAVRHEGESVVLEPIKPTKWPDNFFDSIHIPDSAFARLPQGKLPPTKEL